jgi:hypothetical protein
MRIELHIERLVVDGLPFTAVDGQRLGAAVEASLGRALGAGDAADYTSVTEAVRRTTVHLMGNPTIAAAGSRIGAAIGDALRTPGPTSVDHGHPASGR